MAEFKERIKDLRLKKGFSQQRLADLLEVNKQTISQYERGVRFPTKENLEALCDAFNVTSDYLIGREDVSPVLLTGDELALIDMIRNTDSAISVPLARKISLLNEAQLEQLSAMIDVMFQSK
ncbi:helix-turn-helix domain-containing protein [Pseudobutyrivibrio sp.]|uniref:helix-turn-helix domain-containing protein n=1 Tax=Pseudobutyrivibrio sp. TaxID=2014367 RepID=UPI001D7A24DF|nr:helix-turn-helix transcriptional regulator [Pseudobutyrivibrio sp.]MBE5910920.1 helix-turn-helix transcriptional regulator [Pseudobutyrivibrio sp.]